MENLITGTLFLVVGIILAFVLPMPKYNTAEFDVKKSLSTMLRCNVWGCLLIMLGVLRFALYSLNLTDDAITLKNGIFLFAAILSISYVIDKIIAGIKNKSNKTK